VNSNAKTVSAYRKALPADRRKALSRLRAIIRKAAPGVKENMKYGMPYYETGGPLVALAAQKHYLALYLCEPDLIEKYVARLGRTNCGKGCIRFRKLEDLALPAVTQLLAEAANRHRK